MGVDREILGHGPNVYSLHNLLPSLAILQKGPATFE